MQAVAGGAIFLGFPIEAMPASNQQALLMSVLDWVGQSSLPCPSDCNGDGQTDVNDLLAIIEAWGSSSGCDVNEDGIIDVVDLLEVVAGWGACP